MFRITLFLFSTVVLAIQAAPVIDCPGTQVMVELIDTVVEDVNEQLSKLKEAENKIAQLPSEIAYKSKIVKETTDASFADLENKIGSDEDINKLEENKKVCVLAVKESTNKRKAQFNSWLADCLDQKVVDASKDTISNLISGFEDFLKKIQERRTETLNMQDKCGTPESIVFNGETEKMLRGRTSGQVVAEAAKNATALETRAEQCVEVTGGRTGSIIENLRLFNLACRA